MTSADKAKLFGSIFPLLDSPVEGERLAALNKLHDLRHKMGWPGFGDLLNTMQSAITPAQLQAAEAERDQWMQAHDQRERENAALVRRNAALAGALASLRMTLWMFGNWSRLAAVLAVVGFGGSSYFWLSPVVHSFAAAVEADPNPAVDAGLRAYLGRAAWVRGDSAPVAVTVAGSAFWIVLRGTLDADSHADAHGRPIARHCLQLYARPAVSDDGAFLTPHPYLAFGWLITWPVRAAECRLSGRAAS